MCNGETAVEDAADRAALFQKPHVDKFGREITEGSFIVYPTMIGHRTALKLGFVVELRHNDRGQPWLSLIGAERWITDGWTCLNKGKRIAVQNTSEVLIVPASSVPAEARTMLKNASVGHK